MPAESGVPWYALRGRRSVFWKVAGVLVGVQVATGLVAVGLSAYLAEGRSLDLVRNSLLLRLDSVAEEVETRARFITDGAMSRIELGPALRADLADRVPDPVYVLDADGRVFDRLNADSSTAQPAVTPLQPLLADGSLALDLDASPSWALVPLYDADGVPAGGLYVSPLTTSLERERAGTREATRRAYWIVGLLALGSALVLGALVTLGLVRPLRTMTARVEALGAGDYAARLPDERDDEFGRLADAINTMAGEVEASIASLQATDQLRRDLVANIGHDLRTPLAALRGYLEEGQRLASEGRAGEATEAFGVAERQARHMDALVRDLFELSVLDAGGAPALRREPVPLAELLSESYHAHRQAFEASGIDLDLTLAPDLPTLDADGARLFRVIGNLLDNARRHTPAGGIVRLRAYAEGDDVVVHVADTGAGIPNEAQAHLFERYYRGDDVRTRGTGSGLGLAISRATARAHGGDLTVESAVGQGSTFTLRLPTDAEARAQ